MVDEGAQWEVPRRWARGPVLAAIERAAGLTAGVPSSILRHQPHGGPRGSKVLVVSREPMKQVGGIWVPPDAQQCETDGWVLAASWDADTLLEWEEGQVDRLLGLHVSWGRFVGTVLKASEYGDDWEGRFLLMLEADVLTVMGHVMAPTKS